MNWITDIVKPRLKDLVGKKTEVPDNLWHKCPGCGATLFHRDLTAQNYICSECGYHLKLPVEARIDLLFDEGWQYVTPPTVLQDPLKFKDRKRYSDRLKEAQAKTKRPDALLIVKGTINAKKAVLALFDFEFQGGSMGMAVGESFVHAAELAVKEQAGFIAIPASGGARMQEGILSLMQLPRTLIAVERVRRAKLPYIVLLTDPTTGGISASFAMVGDVHLAEPGATIGFAGRRVIEQTVRETLPEGFQTAEYLHEHGMIDQVVARPQQKQVIGNFLDLLMNKAVKDE